MCASPREPQVAGRVHLSHVWHMQGLELETKPFTWECAGCHRQTSVTAGTVMHRSKLPMRTWFEAVRPAHTLSWSPCGGRRNERAANLPLEDLPPVVAPISQTQTASMLNVSERTVRAAVKVKDDGAPNLSRRSSAARCLSARRLYLVLVV